MDQKFDNALSRIRGDGKVYSPDGKRGPPSRVEILGEASEAVNGRDVNYGKPENNFARIARRWELHFLNRYGFKVPVDLHDVVMMMEDLKLARLEGNPGHTGSWIDIAGYAACGGELGEPAK